MPDSSQLDPYAILSSLHLTDATEVVPVTGGATTAIWRVNWQGASYALRVFRPDQASVYETEIAAMQTAERGQVPVPTIVRRGMWQGRPVLLLSWLNGSPLIAAIQAHPRRIWQLGTAFGRMQAAIHHLDTPPDMDAKHWIEWAGDEPELKARLYALPSRKTKLIHLDYHPLNVMADGEHISGVIDWTNARAGDPRADFARTYAILRVEPYGPDGDPPLIALARRLLERAWRSGYTGAAGHQDDMPLFYAWAGASMIRDLAPRIGKPGFWLQDHHLDSVRAWRDDWKHQAGIR